MKGRRVLEVALLLGAGYGVVVGALFFLQDGMLFPRDATAPPWRALPPAVERLTLATDGGATIHGLWLPPEEGLADTIVVGFPGNAWNAQDFAMFLHDGLPTAEIVVFHYRGYAPSEGRPSERALVGDARRIVDLVAERGRDAPIVVVGMSIGSGVAAQVASRPGVAGAVLVTPFDSVRALAQARYPWVPVGPLLRHPFDSVAALRGVERPVAVIAAGRDTLVPPARTRALVAQVPNVVSDRVVEEATHNDLYDHPRFPELLREAVGLVRG